MRLSLWDRRCKKQSALSVGACACLAGQDQTRGWFYTLMVLSTALFGKPAFRNLVCNGLVLADDGKKMSKRLKNYPVRLQSRAATISLLELLRRSSCPLAYRCGVAFAWPLAYVLTCATWAAGMLCSWCA